jgi:hypothetical protein
MRTLVAGAVMIGFAAAACGSAAACGAPYRGEQSSLTAARLDLLMRRIGYEIYAHTGLLSPQTAALEQLGDQLREAQASGDAHRIAEAHGRLTVERQRLLAMLDADLTIAADRLQEMRTPRVQRGCLALEEPAR